MSVPTPFARRLSAVARGQYDTYHLQHEHDPPLSKQIQKYWSDLGLAFPGVETPWSAVFVCWCVKAAGATAEEFPFAAAHSVFVHWAIQNALKKTGLFHQVCAPGRRHPAQQPGRPPL
jgi:hypothetical protein